MSASTTDSTPKYIHDCHSCVYLGESDGADLYYCAQRQGFPTVVARYSSDGSDYISGAALANMGFQPLATAKEIALARGFKV